MDVVIVDESYHFVGVECFQRNMNINNKTVRKPIKQPMITLSLRRLLAIRVMILFKPGT